MRPRGEGCALSPGIARQIARSGYFDFIFSPISIGAADSVGTTRPTILPSNPSAAPRTHLSEKP